MTHDVEAAAPAFFSDPISEKLFQSVVALAGEVYVLRERLLRLEGSEPPPPLPAADAACEAEAFMRHVFGHLAAP